MKWIARHADGWMTTPRETEVAARAALLRNEWADAGREGDPEIRILIAKRPEADDLADWEAAGAAEMIWGVPDAEPDIVVGYLDKLAGRLGLSA